MAEPRIDMKELNDALEGGVAPEEWMEREGISFVAMNSLANLGIHVMSNKVHDGTDLYQAISEVLANAFVMGWECSLKLSNRLDDKLFEAFVAGFGESGEGHNNEYNRYSGEDESLINQLRKDFEAWRKRNG